MIRNAILVLLAALLTLTFFGCASNDTPCSFDAYDRFNTRLLGPDALYDNPEYRCGYESYNNYVLGPGSVYDDPSYREYEEWSVRLGPDGLYEPCE